MQPHYLLTYSPPPFKSPWNNWGCTNPIITLRLTLVLYIMFHTKIQIQGSLFLVWPLHLTNGKYSNRYPYPYKNIQNKTKHKKLQLQHQSRLFARFSTFAFNFLWKKYNDDVIFARVWTKQACSHMSGQHDLLHHSVSFIKVCCDHFEIIT